MDFFDDQMNNWFALVLVKNQPMMVDVMESNDYYLNVEFHRHVAVVMLSVLCQQCSLADLEISFEVTLHVQ